MSSTSRAGSYRDVLLLPNALRTFAPALLGRLSYGLLPLSALFTVQHSTGSFATAGTAVAAFGLASLSMPFKARLVDRHSQRRVLPVLAALCAAGLAGMAFLGTTDAAGPALVILAGVTGLLAPPLGPSMRSNWRLITDQSPLKERAYALDSISEESLYLGGPLIAGVLISLWSAPGALLLTSALMITGTFLMVSTPLARHRAAPVMPRRFLDPGPLAAPGLRRIMLIILVTAAGISVAYICVAAVAQGRGEAGAAGYLEAGIGLGSVVGGLAWGRRNHTRSRSQHLAGLIGVLAAGLLAASLTSNLVVLGVVMAFAGVAVAPLFVVSYLASDDVTPAHQRTEASTWINTANNLGSSTGASVAGLAIDRIGPSWGFFAGGLLLTLTLLAILLSRRSIDVPASIGTANSG